MTEDDRTTPHDPVDSRVQRRSALVLKRRIVDQEREQFGRALEWATEDPTLERTAGIIVAARRRLVLGSATSFTYASLLANELSPGLANVTLVDGTIVRPLDVLSDVRATDVMIAISLSRYSTYTVDIAEPFTRVGGTLIVITDSTDAPLVPFATETLIVDAPSGTPTNSPTSVALVIHILATLTIASAKGASRRLLERERLAESLGLYVKR